MAVGSGGRPRRRRWSRVLVYLVLGAGAVTMAVPFLDMFLGAMKTPAELLARPPVWIPRTPQWNVFLEIWSMMPMARWYLNSLIVAGSITVLVLLTSSLGGLALAKYRFKGRELIFRFVLVAQMFPLFLFLIPNYIIMARWPLAGGNDLFGQGGSGLLGTYFALILPFAVNWWGIFMMRQFMVGLPDEFMDAARIDGCSEWRIYWQVILPMVRPALATLGIFVFLMSWNEFIWTMTVTRAAPDLQTVPVGIQLMRDTFDPTRNAALRRAALAVSTLPVMVLFLSLQRHYVRGLVMTGLKG
ncbi:carbohydrate ABC transporter permease [Limnochorda pilosa]|uniref:carbohydrate ABC transporter permease n=1 Tax=Limnochorda pilosa TaxID=1555112 RepID=UPI0018E07A57|nr:carbohydrate ABC transporter permease [Limnochorda pilosa]